MTYELESALDALFAVLKSECKESNVVAVDITYTSQGSEINFRRRTAEGLKRDGISMHDICGEWVK